TVAALVGCAITTGCGAVLNRARVGAGSSLAVFGAGGVGLSAIMAARLAGADHAIESSGAPGAVAAAFRAVRRGGTLVCVGIPPENAVVELPGAALVRDEKVVTGSHYGSCRPHTDMPMLLDLYLDGRLPLDRLVGATYPLDEIDRAFADLREGGGVRTLIDLT